MNAIAPPHHTLDTTTDRLATGKHPGDVGTMKQQPKEDAVEIFYLKDKLDLLFKHRLNPDITKFVHLADKLGVKRAAVSMWGSEDHLPDDRVKTICDLFLIPEELLWERHLGDFERHLLEYLEELGLGWQRLVALGESSDELQVVPVEASDLSGTFRGIGETVAECENLDSLAVGERFQIDLQGPPGWHVILLFQDLDGVHCLRPSAEAPDSRIEATGHFLTPQHGESFYAKPPVGKHTLLAVLKQNEWGQPLYQHLQSAALIPPATYHMTTLLKGTDRSAWKVLRKDFCIV